MATFIETGQRCFFIFATREADATDSGSTNVLDGGVGVRMGRWIRFHREVRETLLYDYVVFCLEVVCLLDCGTESLKDLVFYYQSWNKL